MNSHQPIYDALDHAVNQGIAPGMALAFGCGEESLFHYSTGMAMSEPHCTPLRNSALFDLASLTKVLATTLILMRMCERGTLAIDSTLAQLRPNFYEPEHAALSLRQFLAHCSGLPSSRQLYREQVPQSTQQEKCRQDAFALARKTPLVYAPGSETRYSDLGPILLGELLEHLCQQRLDHLFAAEVCAPLKLEDAFFVHLQTPLPHAQRPSTDFVATENCLWRQRVVCGQVHDENAYLLSGVAGHAGLFATLRAVEKLAQIIVQAAAGKNDYLSPETIDLFTKRQNLVPGSSRALGWDTPSENSSSGHYFSPNSFGHTGFTGTSLWIDKETDYYIVLLANRIHPNRNNRDFPRFRPELHDLVVKTMQLPASS
ncbi:MAG: CubicO group peptidase (beta-lactamase class C family) [Candidatus Latescibacterota bacterium]